MLGWDIHIQIFTDGKAETLARMRGSFNACRWLDDLVVAGKATNEGGDGYPVNYKSWLEAIRPYLSEEIHIEPPLHVQVLISDRKLNRLDPNTTVSIECWDQS